MDTSDPEISFNHSGLCNHCQYFENNVIPAWPFYNDHTNNFDSILSEVKSKNRNNSPYDCIVGISGGVDSSYLVYKLKGKDINPLILHVDAGWNSELAIENINKIVDYSGFDLETYVVNWDAMREVQLAFLKSGIANQDVPQDHVFIAAMYLVANKYNIKTILSGSNYATESILPQSWGYDATDRDHLKSICIKYGGGRSYRKIPTMRFFDQVLINPIIKNIQIVSPLNSMSYSKTVAIKELEFIGWRYYGGKHYESRWTHFFQSYYLPEKHGFDKRRAHLSSLVVTGEINRQTAVEEMQKPLYNEKEIQKDLLYISQKLRIKLEELKSIISNAPLTHYTEHGNWKKQRDDFYAKYYSKALGFRNYLKNL
jgi:N-acetyl sugar amidotransferase